MKRDEAITLIEQRARQSTPLRLAMYEQISKLAQNAVLTGWTQYDEFDAFRLVVSDAEQNKSAKLWQTVKSLLVTIGYVVECPASRKPASHIMNKTWYWFKYRGKAYAKRENFAFDR